jgi:cytochrome c oxidase subunit III
VSGAQRAAMREALREPWLSLHRQRQAAGFGMWVFLASEALFFGGLLLTYAAYRTLYPDAFAAAARETNIVFGTVNTAVLLTSSLTMAAAAEAAEAAEAAPSAAAADRLRRLVLHCLAATACLGLAFLVVKGFEYAEDIREHLVPGAGFKLDDPRAQVFFAFYWVSTVVHAIHLSVGIGVVTTLAVQAWRGTRSLASPAFEGAALFWHLVDIIWIFLYPLLYLPGRAG